MRIGDRTAGLGASHVDLSYFSRLARNPEAEFTEMKGRCLAAVIPNLTTKNIAVSGSNSIQHLVHIDDLEAHDVGVMGIVVMTTGGNDLIHWYGRGKPREGAMYGATLQQAQPRRHLLFVHKGLNQNGNWHRCLVVDQDLAAGNPQPGLFRRPLSKATKTARKCLRAFL